MGNEKANTQEQDGNDTPAPGARAEELGVSPINRVGSVAMIALLVGISLVSGAIGAVAIDKWTPPPPKILVLDMAGLLDPIANDPALSAYDKRRLTEDLGAALNRAMQSEADEGAIILDASMVLMAPGGSYVQPL